MASRRSCGPGLKSWAGITHFRSAFGKENVLRWLLCWVRWIFYAGLMMESWFWFLLWIFKWKIRGKRIFNFCLDGRSICENEFYFQVFTFTYLIRFQLREEVRCGNKEILNINRMQISIHYSFPTFLGSYFYHKNVPLIYISLNRNIEFVANFHNTYVTETYLWLISYDSFLNSQGDKIFLIGDKNSFIFLVINSMFRTAGISSRFRLRKKKKEMKCAWTWILQVVLFSSAG